MQFCRTLRQHHIKDMRKKAPAGTLGCLNNKDFQFLSRDRDGGCVEDPRGYLWPHSCTSISGTLCYEAILLPKDTQ